MKFSLAKREGKTDDEIKHGIKTGKYNPKKDPLMGRLFRKFDSKKSVMVQSAIARRRGQSSILEASKFENHVRYKSGTGHGSTRTYLMINPLKMMSKNK